MSHTIHKVDTIRDFLALPIDLQLAIRQTAFNPHGKRWVAEMRKAERKIAIQRAVQRALVRSEIGENLAVEILKCNNAYGPQGKNGGQPRHARRDADVGSQTARQADPLRVMEHYTDRPGYPQSKELIP